MTSLPMEEPAVDLQPHGDECLERRRYLREEEACDVAQSKDVESIEDKV